MRYCIQHLNDLSGSPLILLERMQEMGGDDITLITNQTEGFLSGWTGHTVRFSYTKHRNNVLRFLSLSWWYLKVAAWLAFRLRDGDRLIVSTLISSPLLAIAILRSNVAADLMVNEIFFRVPLWRTLGLSCAKSSKVRKIYLSRFVRDFWNFGGPSEIIYPNLRKELIALSNDLGPAPEIDPNALKFFLVGSQIEAKGYRLFIEIARHYDQAGAKHRFHLYLSGNRESFERDYPTGTLPTNLSVTFNQSSPTIFQGHDIFLGLTNTSLWLETFGQTFAEAMMMGNIVIVPDKGAQLEYIEDGKSGFFFTAHTKEGVIQQIERVLASGKLDTLAKNSRDSIRAFYEI